MFSSSSTKTRAEDENDGAEKDQRAKTRGDRLVRGESPPSLQHGQMPMGIVMRFVMRFIGIRSLGVGNLDS